MSYATSTSVSVEKSEGEIKALLRRYGADQIGTAESADKAMVTFSMRSRVIRFVLPLPDKASPAFARSPGGKKVLSPEARLRSWEQACRSRWRALLLSVKAKLESVEIGISQFEEEFLAHIVDPATNRTVGEDIVPQIAMRYQQKGSPVCLIGFKGGGET
jgi:hypothetical protein